MNPTETLVPIALFAMIFGCVYVGVTARHRQRIAMIEKGMDPGIRSDGREKFHSLKFGMLAVGVGLGLFLGRMLAQVMPPLGSNPNDPDPDNPIPYLVMVLLCGGAALIAHHFIVRNKG